MYQSRKKQVKWQFEFQFSPEHVAEKPPDIPPPSPKINPNQPKNPIVIYDEVKVEENKDDSQSKEQQQVQKIVIPKHTKSKNYYVFNRDIYILNNVEVCDFACQYSPPRMSLKNRESENNAHQYTIEKPTSEVQNMPVLSQQQEFDLPSKLNSEKKLNLDLSGKENQPEDEQIQQDEILQCNMSEAERENMLLEKMVDMKKIFGQRKNDPECFLILKHLTSQFDLLQGIKENQQIVIQRLVEYLRNEVDKQNKIIAEQKELCDQEKYYKAPSNRVSVSSQTIKKFEIEQNDLPKLLGYQASSLEQDLDNNEYIITYQLKYGYSIITFKTINKIRQSEELNKVMQDFAEKFNNKQLYIVGLDLRIHGVVANFLPYAELVQSVVTNRYTSSEGQIEKNYIANIINLLPYMVKKFRKLEKQLVLLQSYGVLWTHLYNHAKIVMLVGYRSLLKYDSISQDQLVIRIDYDLLEFKYEIQFEITRLEALAPFYSKIYDINYLQVGKQFPFGAIYEKLLQLQEAQDKITNIVRAVNAHSIK